jgi:signal transduction histidine kinase
MRRTFVRSTVLVVLLAIMSLAALVHLLERRAYYDEAKDHLTRQAEALTHHFTQEIIKGDELADEVRDDTPPDYRLDLLMPDGTLFTKGPTGFSSELSVSVPGPVGSTLTLSTSGDVVAWRSRTALIVITVTSLLVVAGAGLIAWWQARRLTAPLASVVMAADEMGAGDLSLKAPPSGIPEVDAVVDALNRLAERVKELVRAEREFSSNASHQLRSGLTSLRLRLEALAQAGHDDVTTDANAALAQAEKLSDTVADLLQLARTGRAGEATRYDLTRVVRHHVARIEPAVHNVGREIRLQSARASVEILGSPSALGQAVDVLLSNALAHGGGDIRVDIASEDGSMSVTVADDGPGITDESLATLLEREPDDVGHGIGLALARTLIEAEGGRLDLIQPRPPVFRLRLPFVREP